MWPGSRSTARQTGSATKVPSRVPAFQPPSYYAAAAAGLSPRPETARISEYTSESPLSNQTVQGVPLSYPTAGVTPDETYEKHEPRQRKRSLSRSFARAMHREHDTRPREENRHQMTDIPFLETQLLPSLRDTIDKMTHVPPRQGGYDDETAHGREQGQFDKHSDDYSRNLVVSRTKPTSRTPVMSSAYTSALAATTRPHSNSTPVTPALGTTSAIPLDSPAVARFDKNSLSKATSRIPGTSRVSAKSTPRLDSSHNSPVPNTALPSHRLDNVTGKSLRTVRGIPPTSNSPGLSPVSISFLYGMRLDICAY